jgi:CheY-like chemotaxis protein
MWRKAQEVLAPGAHYRAGPLRSRQVADVCLDNGPVEPRSVRKASLRVLIVDDYMDAADSLGLLVTLWGHEARVAYDAEAALRLAAAYQPDVLLVDLAMPKTDGCQLARQLRREDRFKGTLLVATTGYADDAHRLLAAAADFDLYLIKPFEPARVEGLLLREQCRLAIAPAVRRRSD